jgi:hypothetical protein
VVGVAPGVGVVAAGPDAVWFEEHDGGAGVAGEESLGSSEFDHDASGVGDDTSDHRPQ